jgi:hypothetical protein
MVGASERRPKFTVEFQLVYGGHISIHLWPAQVSSHVALSQDINHVIQFLARSRLYLQSCVTQFVPTSGEKLGELEYQAITKR